MFFSWPEDNVIWRLKFSEPDVDYKYQTFVERSLSLLSSNYTTEPFFLFFGVKKSTLLTKCEKNYREEYSFFEEMSMLYASRPFFQKTDSM